MSRIFSRIAPCLAAGLFLCVTAVPDGASAQLEGRNVTRIRIGLEGGVGGAVGSPHGLSLGLFGQLGVQWNHRFALFYQPSIFGHAVATGDQASAFFATGQLAMMDFTFGPLQIGAGGGVDIGHFAVCSSNTCVDGPNSVNPAIGGRVALVIGFPLVRARWGIPIGLQVHSTFIDANQRLTSLILTIGIQRY